MFRTAVAIFACAMLYSNAYAASCATADDVRDRHIPTDYDWSVNEEVSLDNLLSVTHLYGVTIENYGEFVSCKYEAAQQYIRLDGAPKNSKCPVRTVSDNWFVSDSGRTVCGDEDKTLCRFDFGC